jgi:tetratricopeptide (TPR) repeat protein
LRTDLVAGFAGVPGYRQDLACSHANLALALRARGRPDDALAEYRRALTLQKKLTEEFRAVAEFRHDRAISHSQLGLLLNDRRRSAEAEDEYRQAIALFEQLVAEVPAARQYSLDLGGTCCNLGHALVASGRTEDALEWYHKAIQVLSGAVEKDRQSETARRFLRNSHYGRAKALSVLGRYPKALADWEQAVLLSAEKDRPAIRVGQADAVVRTGEHARAFQLVNEAAADGGLSAENVYLLACVCGRAAGLVPENGPRRDVYASRAVALLARARDAGFFKDPARAGQLLRDESLAPLQPRTDYQKFLKEVRPGAAPDKSPSRP